MTFEQVLAISYINDLTEHRHGSGPLEDSWYEDQKLLKRTLRGLVRSGYDVSELCEILGIKL